MSDGIISWTTKYSAFGTWLNPNVNRDKAGICNESKKWARVSGKE